MKALIYSNTGLTSKQIGFTAEVIESLKVKHYDLKIVICNSVLENCYANTLHNPIGCASCQSRFQHILNLIGISKEETSSLKRIPEAYSMKFPLFDSLENLVNFKFHDIDVGRGAASSIISYKRDFNLTSWKYGKLIEIELKKSINVLLNFEQLVKAFQPDEIYLYNGRFAEVYPVMQLCKKLDITFYTIEAGAGIQFELYKNNLPHSISLREAELHKIWDQNPNEKAKSEIAKNWFRSRRSGEIKHTLVFTKSQIKDNLPKNFDLNKENIVIFNSSEDELKAIMEWKSDLFNNQNQAINEIIAQFIDRPDLHFYLRVHPNLGKVKNAQIEEISEMNYPNLTVIFPNDPIDTYFLMENCDKVISFGSTTGIEATYWGTPSILYGKSFYMHQGCVYLPKNLSELEEFVLKKDLSPLPKETTFKYGYYMSVHGTKSKYFNYRGVHSYYKGVKLKKVYITTVFYLFQYLKNIQSWLNLHKYIYGKSISLSDLTKFK